MATIPMEDLLRLAVDEGASDLHISVGAPPALRINGEIVKLDAPAILPADVETLVRAITSDFNLQRVQESGTADFAIAFRDTARFRVSVFRQKGHLGLVIRQIPRKMLSLAEIGLPPAVRPLLDLPRGLILVTGTTGSGKSTTLASMIDHINEHTSSNIITIEDPIEFLYKDKKSIISQREVLQDTNTFGSALRSAFRQDPDVVVQLINDAGKCWTSEFTTIDTRTNSAALFKAATK